MFGSEESLRQEVERLRRELDKAGKRISRQQELIGKQMERIAEQRNRSNSAKPNRPSGARRSLRGAPLPPLRI